MPNSPQRENPTNSPSSPAPENSSSSPTPSCNATSHGTHDLMVAHGEVRLFGASNHEGVTPLADRPSRPYVVSHRQEPCRVSSCPIPHSNSSATSISRR